MSKKVKTKSLPKNAIGEKIKLNIQSLFLESSRFHVIVLVLLICGMPGGEVVGLVSMASTPLLILTVIPMALTLAMVLAAAPMRWIIWPAIFAIITDIMLILYFTL